MAITTANLTSGYERLKRNVDSTTSLWIATLLSVAIAAYHYWRAVHPGVGPFLDSVEYQTAVATSGVSHAPGHPLYLFFGALFSQIPWGDRIAHFGDNPAFRLNMMSVVFSTLTVAITVHLVYRLTNRTVPSLLAGLALAGAVRFWFQATYTELYPLYTFLVALTVYSLVAWQQTRRHGYYYLSVASYAFSFGVNVPAIVLLPAWLWAVLTTDHRMLTRPRTLAVTALIVLAAAGQYFFILLRALVYGPPAFCNYCPDSWAGVPDFLSGRQWWGITFGVKPEFWLQRWADSGYQLMLQFWPIGVMLGAIGLAWLARKSWRTAGLFVVAMAGTWFFVVSYDVVDWSDFMTPVYVLYAPLIGCGILAVWEWLQDRMVQWKGKAAPAARATVVVVLVFLPVAFLFAVFRNNAPLVNQSESIHWQWWARDLLKQMEDDAWVLAPPTATDGFAQSWALRYVAWTEELAPGLQLVYTPGHDPPGPEPGYLSWEKAKPDLAKHAVYVIERNDERLDAYALLPITRADGWMLGYRVVGQVTPEGVVPWVGAEIWADIEEQIILP